MNGGAFGENFPYTNFHDLNLDWIIKTIKYLEEAFKNINVIIKIADPPIWDISKQYEKDTIVFYDNKAYISTAPVPAGTSIFNEDYWAPIIDINELNVADPAEWDITKTYMENTLVSNDNSMYVSKTGVPANTPLTNTDYWRLVYSVTFPDIHLHRVYGKQIAVYGDSWATPIYGTPWLNYLSQESGHEVHVRALGSQPMSGIYALFDNFYADIYIIEGGLNDVSLNTGGDAFRQAIISFVNAIKAVNQDAEIYFMTPTNITRTTLLNYRFPLEFYRTYIWRLAGIYRYNVINGLKITDIRYSDQVHPTAETAENIGKHIVAAIDTYGDDETHMNEYTNLGRGNNQILFEMIDGSPKLVFNNTSITLAAGTGGWEGTYVGTIELSLGTSFTPSMGFFGFAKNNAPQTAFIYAFTSYYSGGIFACYSTEAGTILAPCEVPLIVNAWQKGVE